MTNWFMSTQGTAVIAWLAFTLALADLILHVIEVKRNRVSLNFESAEPGYSFGMIMSEEYHCAFCFVRIVNRAASAVTISALELIDEHGKHLASPSAYDIPDYDNENGLTLYSKENPLARALVNLKSENILNHMRLDSYDSVEGYMVFINAPIPVSQTSSYSVVMKAAGRSFRGRVSFAPLPDDLSPKHPL